MKIGQYCQRQRCKHVELEQFWHAFASCGFVSDSWAFLFEEGVPLGVDDGTVGRVMLCSHRLSAQTAKCYLSLCAMQVLPPV